MVEWGSHPHHPTREPNVHSRGSKQNEQKAAPERVQGAALQVICHLHWWKDLGSATSPNTKLGATQGDLMDTLDRREVIRKLEELEQMANSVVINLTETSARGLAGEIRTYLEKLKGIK